MNNFQSQFREDGIVFVEGALDAAGVAVAEDAFNWSLHNPGPGAGEVLGGTPGAFYQDHANPNAYATYRALLCDTGLADLVADVIGTDNLWLMYEQIWLKEGGETRPTPWHQDLAYIPVEGDHIVTAWLNLDPVPKECSLQFVPGSHRGPLYNPTAFDAHDVSASMFADGVWPPLPDIAANPDAWPILSWAVSPGDVVVFHQALLHGGAPTRAGGRRRSISLRFFGDHAFCAQRPEMGVADTDRLQREDGGRDPIEQLALMPPGSPFRHPGFPKVR